MAARGVTRSRHFELVRRMHWLPGMLSDARIRLEGQLEVLERASIVLGWADAAAKRGTWAVVLRGLEQAGTAEVRAATSAVHAMAGEEPELAQLLKQVVRARIALVDTVRERALALGLPGLSPRQQVQLLIEQPALFEKRVRSEWLLFTLLPSALFLAATSLAWSQKNGWVPTVIFGVVISLSLVPHLLGVYVLVTRHVLGVGGQRVQTRDVARVRFSSPRWRTSAHRYRMEIFSSAGRVEIPLPSVPTELVATLKSLGIEVDCQGLWWF